MRRVSAAVVAALLAAGCGGTHHKLTLTCPAATNGHGTMGACNPPAIRYGLRAGPPQSGETFPDLSNNDPVYNMRAVARHGHPAFVGKVNQGTRFVDRTYARMVREARAAGMSAGGYDFVQNYNAREAYLFVDLLKRTSTCNGARTLPPTLDVEYGAYNTAGLRHMLAIVVRSCGRAQIYTGAWYWGPHAGCWWPANTVGWISGYPYAPKVCGLPGSLYLVHQFGDNIYNGVLRGDMNRWLGTPAQWQTFTGSKPDQRPLLKRRARLRGLLLTRKCRARRHRHKPLGPKCSRWFAEGDQINRALAHG